MNSFRDLRVWNAGMNLVESVYCLTRRFPKEETYGLAIQIRRAAISIPSNIAEGHSREHLKEYLHHLSIAQASVAELDTQLEIAVRLRYLSQIELGPTLVGISALGKQLRSLRKALCRKA